MNRQTSSKELLEKTSYIHIYIYIYIFNGWVLNTALYFEMTEAAVRRLSSKKVFLKISQYL